MYHATKKPFAVVCCLVLLGLAVPVGAETRQIEATPGETLTLDLTTGGSLDVRGWSKNLVEVTSRITGRDAALVELTIERSGDGVSIRTRLRERKKRTSLNLKLEINVPDRFDIRFETMGGGVDLSGIEGEFNGQTMGGELNLRDLTGRVELSTMGGNIDLHDSEVDGSVSTMGGNVRMENIVGNVSGSTMGGNVVQKNVRPRSSGDGEVVRVSSMGGNLQIAEAAVGATLSTMGGNIDVQSVGEFLEAETMGGNINVQALDGWARTETMGGNVTIRVVEGPAGSRRDVEMLSHGGELTLKVPSGFSMDVDITLIYTKDSKRNYSIRTDLPIEIHESAEWDYGGRGPNGEEIDEPFKVIRGTASLGGGSHKVRLRTVNGDVRLHTE